MRRYTYFLALLVTFFLVPDFAVAQTDEKVAIEVVEDATDMVGRRLIYQIKEGIRRSASMRITTVDESRLQVLIHTMPRYQDTPSVATIYSVVWLISGPEKLLPTYLDSTLGYCGSDVVPNSAESIVAQTDELVTKLRKLANQLDSQND